MASRILTAAASVIAVGLLVTGCTAPASTAPPKSATPAAAAYPLTLDNCGTSVTFASAPQRVLAIKSTSIEMMLALGLEDHIVGTAFSDGPYAEEWAAAGADLPVVSDRVPSQEATLALNPDLVYAGWESNVTADGAGDRATLDSLGVATYVSPSACKAAAYQPDPLTWDDVFNEILEVGKIFDVPDRAGALVDSQRDQLAGLTPDDRGFTALWYSSGSDTPYVGAGIGAPQMIMDSVGLKNIAADIHDTWSSISWEAVVAADPDVIVLVDSSWGTVDKKISVLEANPATAQLRAVREHRYLVVPFPAGEAGVRNVEAVDTLLTQLKTLGP